MWKHPNRLRPSTSMPPAGLFSFSLLSDMRTGSRGSLSREPRCVGQPDSWPHETGSILGRDATPRLHERRKRVLNPLGTQLRPTIVSVNPSKEHGAGGKPVEICVNSQVASWE
ncbi:hypothetical protein V8C42DRAFT_309599 [Trichoderma barbatum]